ncbi:cellulose binding domain-containing protein [Micromonospora sp. NPDC049836]|uniref:cellulose binding domain-containing protein n=1 Tax=Micromonospora sp. NPDC049836 TaxID=3364274 RepID=UPI003795288D
MTVSRRVALAGVAVSATVLAVLAPVLAGSAATVPWSAGGCSATAHIDSAWGSGTTGGEIVTVTVVNTSATAATTWTVSWTLGSGQRIVSAWGATASTSGSTATAVNAGYNGALGPGASTTFGMQLAGTGPAPVLSCGNDAAPPASGSPSVTPPAGADLTITTADNGTTVTVFAGQALGVVLPADYRPPTVSGVALAQQSSTGGYPTGQPVSALYRAVAPGDSDLSSQTDNACHHTTPPCGAPVALWLVHVKVLPAPSGTGQTVTVTQIDNARTVALRVGDTLEVSLPSMYRPPTVAPSGPLVRSDLTGGYPTGQPLLVRYVAVAAGQADVSTISDGDCLHLPTPCPSPQVKWVVHVTVTA